MGKKVLKEGGMDTSELEEIINQALNKRKFFSSKINYGLITYNLTDKKPVVITKATINKDSFSNYLVASASCFPPSKRK